MPPSRPGIPSRWALLRHDLPGSAWHLDWLIERDPAGTNPDERSLLALRLDSGLGESWRPYGGHPDQRPPVAIEAIRLPDHRRVYLAYEGPVSGGRGNVRRIASGRATLVAEHPDELQLEIGGGPGHEPAGVVSWKARLKHGDPRSTVWLLTPGAG